MGKQTNLYFLYIKPTRNGKLNPILNQQANEHLSLNKQASNARMQMIKPTSKLSKLA